jgi:hypothetical protein
VRKSFNKIKNCLKEFLLVIVDYFVVLLTDPIKPLNPSEATNLVSLKKRLKKSDVLLVSGNARISFVVKVLTLSSWSHVVLYVGDKSELLTEEEKKEWTKKYGETSLKDLVIDADPVRRVHLKPLADFSGLMIRHCRAEALSKEDREDVVNHALGQLGRSYDIKHIIRLLVFFAFPWELFPESLRRWITEFTLSEDDRICSRVLSEAFESVGYPIKPLEVIQYKNSLSKRTLGVASAFRHRRKSAVKLMLGGKFKKAINRIVDKKYIEIKQRSGRHLTPADYDLSRFFSIIKDDEDLGIDYRKAKSFCVV